jgi:hypothetical protein
MRGNSLRSSRPANRWAIFILWVLHKW